MRKSHNFVHRSHKRRKQKKSLRCHTPLGQQHMVHIQANKHEIKTMKCILKLGQQDEIFIEESTPLAHRGKIFITPTKSMHFMIIILICYFGRMWTMCLTELMRQVYLEILRDFQVLTYWTCYHRSDCQFFDHNNVVVALQCSSLHDFPN